MNEYFAYFVMPSLGNLGFEMKSEISKPVSDLNLMVKIKSCR